MNDQHQPQHPQPHQQQNDNPPPHQPQYHQPQQQQQPPHQQQQPQPHPSPATSSPGAERRDEDRAKDAAAKQAHDQRVQHGEAGAKLGGAAVPAQTQAQQPPDSASQSTRAAFAKGADEAAARQQMRQAGLAGTWHDDVIDLMPALGTPPKAAPTLSEVIDLVKEHDRGAMETLRRVYGLPPGQPK